jgi:hypothetical protein
MHEHSAAAYSTEDGYAPATLQTTVNGLRMLLSLLDDMNPEPHEATLRRVLIDAIERALDR